MQKSLYHFSRILVGLVFLFSGFVKAVDPMGTAIKFDDYFNYAFNLPGLTPLSLPFSLIMCALEFSIGILLLINVLPRISAWLGVLLMLVFTPLTFYLAVANPVSDCGCFGDAIKLTNWQTFWKNIVIDFFLVFVFIWKNKFPPKMPLKTRQIIATIVFLFVFGFELYNYSFLPIIDFRPYKVGANIPEMMTIPDDAPQDEFVTTFFYKNKNTGDIEEFTEDNYPWDDTLNYEWADTKSVLVKKGYTPPIHDFDLVDLNDNNLTNYILNIQDTVLLVVTYTLEELNFKNLRKTKLFIDTFVSIRPNTQVFCVTSSDASVINSTLEQLDYPNWTFCKIDEVTSKTIIRSNPGLVILKQGVILEKLHHHSLNNHKLLQLTSKE
ncbi:MAG: DoxX family protein [Bacteroidales bacterium]|nr:DoxX family protein [Bacteroidales bacterium]